MMSAPIEYWVLGGADNNLDYLEVVHVFIRRANSGRQALPEGALGGVLRKHRFGDVDDAHVLEHIGIMPVGQEGGPGLNGEAVAGITAVAAQQLHGLLGAPACVSWDNACSLGGAHYSVTNGRPICCSNRRKLRCCTIACVASGIRNAAVPSVGIPHEIDANMG